MMKAITMPSGPPSRYPTAMKSAVNPASKMAVRIGSWLKDAEAREAVAEKAMRSMDTLAGALERTVSALDPYLMQFRLERRPGDA